ncbi:Dysferlin, partial [Stylophora pistillata]
RSIAQDATELKEKATNVEDTLSDVKGFFQRLQDLAEEYPGLKALNTVDHPELPAVVRVELWFGLEQYQSNWTAREHSEGDFGVLAETYENEVKIGFWTKKALTRPGFSNASGELPLPKEKFQAPEGWEFEGDWYIAPEMRLAFIFANAAVIVTSIVLVFVYFRVCHFLKRHRKTSAQVQSNEVEREKQQQREQKATNSLLMIAVAFILCSFPSCVMVYIINLCHTCNCVLIHWLRDLQFLFILINSASNQFLYAFRMRPFKRAFMTIPAIAWVVNKFGKEELSLNYPTPQQSQSDNTPSLELK